MSLYEKQEEGSKWCSNSKDRYVKGIDILEWKFVKDMMEKLGFLARWVEMVMQCVSTIKYKVAHNGEEIDPIYPMRGLRHGILFPPIFLSYV